MITPKFLITDQGKPYLGKTLKNLLKQKNIEHIVIKPYNHKGNGISERVNQEINFILRINKGKKIKKILKEIIGS